MENELLLSERDLAGHDAGHRPMPARVPVVTARAAPGSSLRLALLLALLYVLADGATDLFPHPRFGVQPWSAHAALAITLVAVAGGRIVPLVFAAVLLAWWIAPGSALGAPAFLCALALTAVYWIAGLGVRRWSRWGAAAIAPRDINALLVVALPAVAVGACIDALRQIAGSELTAAAFPLLWFRIFVADSLGLIVLAPALLQALGAGAWRQLRGAIAGVAVRDALYFLLVLGALLELVFGLKPLDEFRMSYLLFLPMIAVAMRYGIAGAVSATPVVQFGLLAALATLGTRAGIAFEFQLLMFTLAIAALYLGALSDERKRSVARIAANERALRERGQALAEAQRVASTAELAAALAHDLSQPLSAIGSYACASQILAERGPDERARLVETLAQISQESNRAGQYLRRMREFFRTGAMREERVELGALFHATYAQFHDRLAQASIEWKTGLEAGLPAVCADSVQIGAVLGNLVANACDSLTVSAPPRLLEIKAFRVAREDAPDKLPIVRIEVVDNGAGVPEALRERLFTPLATSKPGGMGLGLALSRSITQRQGGHLWFDASRERTTFCLDLRIHE